MKQFISHLKVYIFRGGLVLIPLALSFFVLKLFYILIDRRVNNLVDQFIGFRIPGIGIIIFLLTLYVIGFAASNVLGRRLLRFMEHILSRIPIINTTYHIGKQLSDTLSLPEKQVLKRVVLVDFFTPGAWTVGFVTGNVLDKQTGEKLLKIFIPTVPNPTSGYIMILKESMTIDPKWSIEQGMRTVISGGLIGPDTIRGDNG